MPKLQLTRMADGRWRKKHHGKIYYFRGTYAAALEQWLDTVAELKKVDDIFGAPDPKAAKAWAKLTPEEQEESEEEYEAYARPLRQKAVEEAQAKNRRKAEDAARLHVDNYIGLKRAQVSARKVSAKRYDAIRRDLLTWAAWYGEHKSIKEVDEQSLLDYYGHLMGLVEKEEISAITARDRMATLKQLIQHLWELRLVEKPRNFDSETIRISPEAPKKDFFTKEEVKTIIDNCGERLELAVLLMLNCGMTQKDISDLHPSEYRSGRITRKRSKTGHIGSVPEVSYPLWKRTRQLLDKYATEDPNRLLLNEDGGPLLVTNIREDGATVTIDNLRSQWNRFVEGHPQGGKTLKTFRSTSSSMLDNHPEYGRYAPHFLGQSPRGVANKHYITPSTEQFDAAVRWLGEQFGQK